ncbi:major facilitator superfamily domain-containing protein [Xylariaceae sp. FL0255]|nr:major facilitator superfamily domain-containing protein [Xylariaceae sp. FL0255]
MSHSSKETDSIVVDESDSAGSTTSFSAAPVTTGAESCKSGITPVRSNNGYGCNDPPSNLEQGDHGEKVDPFEVSFDGDNDPFNPRGMSHVRKWIIVAIVSLGSVCVTCTSSIYTATYDQMNAEFHISDLLATGGLSLFVLGIALGPLFLGPLSEYRGRRPVYLASWSLFVIWLIPSALAHNVATMLTARFLDGFTGSAFLSVVGGTVSDIFRRDQIRMPMLIISMSPFVGPSLGPLLGGFINYYSSWRWTYYVLIIWSVVLLLAIFVFAPETYHPIKLREKARKMRKETGDDRWKAPMETLSKSILKTVGLNLLRPFQMLIFEPMCLLLSTLSAVLLGVIYLFFGAFPIVFGDVYGFNLWQVGLSFLGLLVGMVLGGLSGNILWRRAHDALVRQNGGVPEPEFHLVSCMAGAVFVPIGLFWFAWSCFPWVHWILPIIGSGIFGCGTLWAFSAIFTFLVDAYPLYAASALAANAFMRGSFAAAFPLFGTQLYTRLGYHWASSVLAFITVALLPLPFIFFKLGGRLRKRSRFTKQY